MVSLQAGGVYLDAGEDESLVVIATIPGSRPQVFIRIGDISQLVGALLAHQVFSP